MIIDISKHQGNINWDVLAPNAEVIFMKATGDKTEGIDPYFHKNAKECVKRGIPIHVYCFTRAQDEAQAKKDAIELYEVAQQYNPISYVLDLEGEALTKNAVQVANAFIDTLREFGIKKIGLYTGHNAFTSYGLNQVKYDYLWIARYGKNTGEVPAEQYHPVACDLWQYTSQAHVPGITANTVDVSILWGDNPLAYFTQQGEINMGKVMIGSARGDEKGGAYGGVAGDQTGLEVSTQEWYKHSKGWRVFRAKDTAAAEKIAWDMQAACDNAHIGYDQYQRDTLYNAAKEVGFNCEKVTTDCETDCSALVRVCCAYAGINLENFNTQTEPTVLLNSGAFVELTGAKYTDSSEYLKRGDILDTKTKGHTVIVLSDGAKANEEQDTFVTLKYGSKGADVKELQENLNKVQNAKLEVDGDFGKATKAAVETFQKNNNLLVDGEYGPNTHKVMEECLEKLTPVQPANKIVTTGNVNIRTGDSTNYGVIMSVVKGTTLTAILDRAGAPIVSENGWYAVKCDTQIGWVSGKYI